MTTMNLSPTSSKLNLGCGTDIREGWINLDSADLPGVDVVHNVGNLPLPFKDGQFKKILCRSVLEHVDYPRLLGELHRILAMGGSIIVQVPHFTSSNNFIDPTHIRLFSIRTLEFFVKNASYEQRAYYFPFRFTAMAHPRIIFEKKGAFFFNRPVEWIINKNRKMQCLYEDTFLSRFFPAANIVITLIK